MAAPGLAADDRGRGPVEGGQAVGNLAVKALVLALALSLAPAEARGKVAPIKNPALINIGFVCRWQARCMSVQQRAMDRALKYVRKHRPAPWKIQACNRNASRQRGRVDWIGFHNCIKNPAILPLRAPRRRAR